MPGRETALKTENINNMNTKIELTELEMEQIVGGNAAVAMATGAGAGGVGGVIAGAGVYAVLAGGAAIAGAPVALTIGAALGIGWAIGTVAGGLAGWYYS